MLLCWSFPMDIHSRIKDHDKLWIEGSLNNIVKLVLRCFDQDSAEYSQPAINVIIKTRCMLVIGYFYRKYERVALRLPVSLCVSLRQVGISACAVTAIAMMMMTMIC